MKILVTGAGGFIGEYTCTFLVRRGHKVIPLLRSGSQAEVFKNNYGTVLVADLLEPDSLEVGIQTKPDTVIHLAAMLPTSFTGKQAKRIADMNKKIDENVFHFCKSIRVGALYASGASVYGLGDGEIKTETSTCNPIGHYVAEKLYGEEMGKDILRCEGLQFTSLRINAPYGPNQKTRTVMNVFIERAIQGLPLLYHGFGTRQQDFIYVDDIAEAISLAIEKGKSGVFNISGGRPVSMKELAELVFRSVNGCQSSIQPSGDEDPQERSRAVFSIEKAKKELGWIPKTSLESGIKKCASFKLGVGR